MLKLLTIPLLICLSSCDSNQLYLAQATYLCESHGNIYTLRPITGVTCKDGTHFSVNAVRETIIPVEEVRQYYSEQAKPLN